MLLFIIDDKTAFCTENFFFFIAEALSRPDYRNYHFFVLRLLRLVILSKEFDDFLLQISPNIKDGIIKSIGTLQNAHLKDEIFGIYIYIIS